MSEGIKFYRTLNNVILCSGINGVLPVKYFDKVIDISGNSLLKKPEELVTLTITAPEERKFTEMADDDFI